MDGSMFVFAVSSVHVHKLFIGVEFFSVDYTEWALDTSH